MSIESKLQGLLASAVVACQKAGLLTVGPTPSIELEAPKQVEHGDYATNLAMLLARQEKKPPRTVAQAIVDHLPKDPFIKKTTIAGPGFINFVIEPTAYFDILKDIEAQGTRYGTVDIGGGARCQIEFVSANPTGPLHVGHGRGAIYGDVLGNVLATAGYTVTKEYYVNDAGVQMQTLGRSVYLRLQELRGQKIEFPAECYQGPYITELARAILAGPEAVRLQGLGEAEQVQWCAQYAGRTILEEIRQDMAACGVTHDVYFSESELHKIQAVEKALTTLRERGKIYDQDGAVWFRTTEYGDDKDRVVRKSDGPYTYFAADIAYHHHKFQQGYARVIDIWGADHAGHVPRMKAAVAALGYDPNALDCVLLQMVNLIRDGQMVQMSTRRAEYETLRDLVTEVGKDVCRYFFLMRSHNAQLDFDMALAKAQTMENPVYYIQYAHARICSIFAKAQEEAGWSGRFTAVDPALLNLPEEHHLAKYLAEYPVTIATAARELEPHRITFYLLELARKFQAYYAMAKRDPRYRVLGQDAATLQTKLYLLKSCQTVIQNALQILGLAAPTKMDKIERDQEATHG